jgi:hypothetical protein
LFLSKSVKEIGLIFCIINATLQNVFVHGGIIGDTRVASRAVAPTRYIIVAPRSR